MRGHPAKVGVTRWDGWFGKRWFGHARFDGASEDVWQGSYRLIRAHAWLDTVWWRLKRRKGAR